MTQTKTYTSHQLSALCTQLAYLYASGTPLDQTLDLLEEGSGFNLEAWKLNAKSAHRLSEIFAQDEAFPKTFVLALQVSEEVGQEEKLCLQMAKTYLRDANLNTYLKETLTMPLVLVSLLLVVLSIISNSILPLFQELMIRLGVAQSVGLTLFLSGLKITSLVGLILWGCALVWIIMMALQHLYKPSVYPSIWAKLIQLFPKTQVEIERAHFTFLAQLLLSGGVDPRKALAMIERPKKGLWASKLTSAFSTLKPEEGLYELVLMGKLYPVLMQNTLNLAARSGRLEEALEQISIESQNLAEQALHKSVQRFEPWLISALTLIVFGILFAMILPLLGILSVMGA